ncbi:aliphatic sulfonate ABC transporter substrate-binding protein [Tessaracoccus terricola]
MTAFSRRQVLIGTAGILGVGALAACSSEDEPTTAPTAGGTDAPVETEPVKVGYIADGNGAMLVNIAEKQGLWAKHGLEAETVVFTNGPLQIQALGTGDIDFGYIGFGALWLPMSGEATVVSVNSNGQADRILAQPGISSIEDLRGKTVGVPEGTSGDILLSLALESAGMTVDDIERVVMDPPTAVSAFISKQVDAVGIWYPHVQTILDQNADTVELVKSADFPELAFPACQVAAPGITDRPELLAKFQAVQKEAFAWAVENRDELNTQLAEFLDIPEDSIASEQEFVDVLGPDRVTEMIADGTIEEWFTTLNEHFVDAEKLAEVAPVADYWLASEYEQA